MQMQGRWRLRRPSATAMMASCMRPRMFVEWHCGLSPLAMNCGSASASRSRGSTVATYIRPSSSWVGGA